MLVLNKQLTEEQRLSKAIVDIMGRASWLAGVIMIGNRVITDDPSLTTACTDGRDEWYNRTFVAGLNDAELRFLILHEVYHKLYRHLITWAHLNKICPRTANISCDYVINVKIADEYGADGWVKMPEGGCFDIKYRDWDSAKVFDDIYDPANGTGGGRGAGKGQGTPQDGHPEGFDEHDWEGAQDMDAEEMRELERDIDEAVRQGALAAGKMGSGGSRNMEELLQTQVDWREVLREFIQTTCSGSDYSTWKRPNRRYVSAGIYMPSGISEQIGPIALHMDMSGSIGAREQQVMISEAVELAKLMKPPSLNILYWDTKVCRHEVYDYDDLDKVATETKPTGGGGTDVRCVPAFMREHNIKPEASIVFTDGDLYSGWGDWDHPVLWCVLDNPSKKPDCGVTVHIKARDM